MANLTPRSRALLRAAELAEETASRSTDSRFHLAALQIKGQLEAELQRVPGAPPKSR
jgi:hypothetical protein